MLTAQQHKAYQFIKHFIMHHGYSPTMAEIATGIGIKSRNVAHRYTHALATAGLIHIVPNRRRNIELIEQDDERDGIPIIGKIAAGKPIEAIEDRIFLNIVEVLCGSNRYILQVQGNSMIGDSICDGDYIICERRDSAANGTIVVALIDNQEATLKRLICNADSTVTLVPSNPELTPMTYPAQQVQIQGIYLGLLRLENLLR